MKSYDVEYGEGTSSLMIDQGVYYGREDGVASASNELIRAQKSNNAPVEVADIVLCTGAQHTTSDELKVGIKNAHAFLKEDGLLVLRALSRPAAAELGTDEIAGWAYEAGFNEKDAISFDSDLMQIGSLLLSGHYGEREVRTKVLKKN
jgi:hypothetical protein